MDKKKIGMFGGAIALCAAIVFIGIVYAAYTRTLTINGSGTVKGAKWDVHFEVKNGESAVLKEEGNTDSGVVSTATGTVPSISPATTVGNFSVELKTPGDYVEYTFDIVNGGDFDAKLTTMPSLAIDYTKCSGNNAAGDDKAAKDANDVLIVCGDGSTNQSKVTYTMTYAENTTAAQTGSVISSGTAVSENQILKAGQRVTVKLRVQYATQSGANPSLPGNDVTLGIGDDGLGFSMIYTQV